MGRREDREEQFWNCVMACLDVVIATSCFVQNACNCWTGQNDNAVDEPEVEDFGESVKSFCNGKDNTKINNNPSKQDHKKSGKTRRSSLLMECLEFWSKEDYRSYYDVEDLVMLRDGAQRDYNVSSRQKSHLTTSYGGDGRGSNRQALSRNTSLSPYRCLWGLWRQRWLHLHPVREYYSARSLSDAIRLVGVLNEHSPESGLKATYHNDTQVLTRYLSTVVIHWDLNFTGLAGPFNDSWLNGRLIMEGQHYSYS